jgi:hypothetical protein
VKAFALLAILALTYVPKAYAADDAPLATDLRCYSPEQRANLARALSSAEARAASLEKDAGKVAPLPLVVTAVLAIGAGFALGFGVSKATGPNP